MTMQLITHLKKRAEIIGSINNLKTAYSGILAYSGDNDGRIPANRGVTDEDLVDDPAQRIDEVQPGLIDLPYVLSTYISEKTFLSPGNKRFQNEGYYLSGVATSYLYKGMGQRLDGKGVDGRDVPLSTQVLLSEIRAYYDHKSCMLTADGRVLTGSEF